MLTGSTVREWDTMLFFKDTASPQEYDQAIFRLQNQYVKTYTDENGDIIKYNMKPQTLLVDFDPNRMFVMQERKSKIYNANVESGGNSELEKRIRRELEISPIITVNKDKIIKVTATDILEAISNYQKDKGIKEEALDIPVDLSVLDNELVRLVIEKENEIGSKAGLSTTAHEAKNDNSDDGDIDVPDSHKNDDDSENSTNTEPVSTDEQKKKEQSFSKKMQSYYTRILLFAFITKDNVISLSDILDKIRSEDNSRIAKNLGLNTQVLSLLNDNTNKFVLSDLDYKIQNLNKLSHDNDMSPAEKASVAVNKFGKLGDAIVITPAKICADMVDLLPDDLFVQLSKTNGKLLDIAGTAGEYAVALYNKMVALGVDKNVIKNSICTIPKSSVCYELVRKLYEMLGLNTANIAKEFVAANLLEVKDGNDVDYDKITTLLTQNKPFDTIKLTDTPKEGVKNMIRFEAVVGNPPYQEDDGGAQKSARPIYNYFVNMGKKLTSNYLSIIMPSRWYAGGKGLDEFRDEMLNDTHICVLHDYLHPEEVFPDTNNRGGICYFLSSNKSNVDGSKVKIFTHEADGKIFECNRTLKTGEFDIFIRDGRSISILDKVFPSKGEITSIEKYISPRKPFGFEGNIVNSDMYKKSSKMLSSPVLCYGKAKKTGYIERNQIAIHFDWIDKWKVYMPYANNIGTELNDDNQNAFVGMPNTICTETFLVVGADLGLNEASATNLCVYLKTKFARFLHSLAKISQHGTAKTYRFVPIQDFTDKSDIDWSKSVAEIDQQLYAKYNFDDTEIAFIESMIKPME